MEKRRNEYFKKLIKREEIDLEKFDLAEAIVLEITEKCFEHEKYEQRKMKKKKKIDYRL